MTNDPASGEVPLGFLQGQTQVFEDIASGVPLTRCLERLARLIQNQIPYTRCCIVLLDEAKQILRVGAAPDLPPSFKERQEGMAFNPAVGTCCVGIQTRTLAVTADVQEDPNWDALREFASEVGIRSCWSQPIIPTTGNVLGAFALYGGRRGGPSTADRETLQIGAHLAAVAIERARHEEERQRSEHQWRAVFEQSLDAVLLVDNERCVVDANPAAYDLFGQQRESIVASNLNAFIEPLPSPTLPDVETRWAAFLNRGDFFKEGQVRRPDGTVRSASFRARANFLPGLHLCVIRDITEQKTAEEALRRAEQLYRSLVETTGTGYLIADAHGRVVDANAKYIHLTGHATLGEIQGRNPLEWTAPHDRERLAVALAVCYGRGRVGNVEVDFLAPGGGMVPVEINATVVPTEDGLRMLSLCHDISGRVATRHELEASQRELESRVDQRTAQLARANEQIRSRARQQESVAELGRNALAGASIEELMHEAAGTVAAVLGVEFCAIVEHADPESDQLLLRACLGWDAEELIGQPVATTDPAFLTGYALRSHEPVVFDTANELRFGFQAGMLRTGVLCGITVRIGGDPHPFGVIGAHSQRVREFTPDDVHFMHAVANVLAAAVERKRSEQTVHLAQQSAVQANNAKGEFLSRMSHELRTPLNAILGFSQLLEIERLSEGQRESVEQISCAGRHLLELVNEVLDISRIDSGNISLVTEPLAVDALLGEALDMIRPLAEAQKIQLIAGPGVRTGGQYVLADRQRVRQVLLNLLSNAVKYNCEGGSVHLDGGPAPDGRHLRLSVRDTGKGIPAEHLSRLFTPFERLGAETTNVEGIGMGLALSKKLVEGQGGELGVDTTVGGGCTFWVDLPVAAAPPLECDAMLDALLIGEIFGEEASATPPSPRTVLHIEDNGPNRLLVSMLVAQRPALRLLTASRGKEGLELAHKHHPDLILLDLHLPDTPGEAVLQDLRQEDDTRETPVIIISADAAAVRRNQQANIGASTYLTKPFNVSQFFKLLDEHLVDKVA